MSSNFAESSSNPSFAQRQTEQFRLTSKEAIFLYHGLDSRLTKWNNKWIEENNAMAETNANIEKKLRQLVYEKRHYMRVMHGCCDMAVKVLKELNPMLDAVEQIEDFWDVAHTANEVEKLLDTCIDQENRADAVNEVVIDDSKNIVESIANPRWRMHPPRHHSTKLLDDHLRHLVDQALDRADAYFRILELNGGTRPKYTSEAYIRKAAMVFKKQVLKHPDRHTKRADPPPPSPFED